MTTLHMETESVRDTARRMQQAGDAMDAELGSLHRALQYLQGNWQGPTSDEFAAEAGSATRLLMRQQEALALLAARLEREVQEWEQMDQRGASGFRDSLFAGGWAGGAAPLTGGGSGAWSSPIAPLLTAVSIGSLLSGVPAWLAGLLNGMFPQPGIVSPLPDAPAPAPPAAQAPAAPSVEPPAAPAPTGGVSYNIPPKSQGDLYGSAACLPTSLSMAMDYFHSQDPSLKTATPQELIGMLDPGDGHSSGTHPGITFDKLNDDVAELGYKATVSQGSMDELSTQLQGGPVVINGGVSLISSPARDIVPGGSYNHSMLVTGINDRSVMLNDPWSGTQKVMPRADFEKMWSGGANYMLVLRP